MDNYIIKKMQTWEKVIPQKIIDTVRKEGSITGSRVFGGWNKALSDIDYMLPPDFPYNFQEVLEAGGYYSKGYSSDDDCMNLYVHTPDSKHIHNLLFFRKQKVFDKWFRATICLKNMKDNDADIARGLKDKTMRLAFFELVKELF